MKLIDIIAVTACMLCCAGLWRFAVYADDVKNTKHKLLWLLPPVLAFVITKEGPELSLLPLYLGAVIAACGFFTEQKNMRQKLAVSAACCMLLSFPVCLCNPRYRAKDLIGDFEKCFAEMHAHYVLTEHKGIDWDALYAKYQPTFAEADRTQDYAAYGLAWEAFCGEFHDGHTNCSFSEDITDAVNAETRRLLGNDYGLCIMHCTDGSFAAVCVDDSLAKYGIHNGTVITAWDGKAPDAVNRESAFYDSQLMYCEKDHIADMIMFDSFPDIDNAAFWSAMFTAGIGGETVNVTYLDDNGNAQTAALHPIGEYFDRFCQMKKTVDQGLKDTGTMQWKKVGKTTACLRIKGMSYDDVSYNSSDMEDYAEMREELRSAVLAYQAQGVRNVIIDLRGNEGGSPHFVKCVAALFAPKGEYYCSSDCVWDPETQFWKKDENGKFVPFESLTLQGEQILGDGRIIVLVNSASISAADHMIKLMSAFENVTIIGFTEPNGSGQAIGRTYGQNVGVSFSNCVCLGEDGEIFIDSGIDRQSGDGDAVQIIPFDAEAIHALFDENQDYVLDKALEMLETK
ncbi:MAG TPA: peptidase S41 [Ruminococcus sp.]|nr:peptidase S41 [Ruminococcus sp.]